MAKYASSRELVVWQKGMDLTEDMCRRLALIGQGVLERLERLALEVGRLLFGLWRALTVVSVCYSVLLSAAVLGVGPWALGLLINGLSLFS